MKRITTILSIIIVLLVSCLPITACGGDKEADNTSPESQNTPSTNPTPSDKTTEQESSDDITWGDMPVYAGAKQIQKGSWAIPPADGDYSKVEWRYYESRDDHDKVTGYYKDSMPDNKWQEMGWMDTPEMSWGIYSKNNEADTAMVWIGIEDGKTFLALMRASE